MHVLIRTCIVIKQCALERDLEMLNAGDLTEVGERGLTLRFEPLSFYTS